MRVPFRGITVRETVMIRGPQGWAEWAPFVEYPVPEASRWLSSAVEWAFDEPPTLATREIELNATLPAVPPEQARAILGDLEGYSVLKLKIAEAGAGGSATGAGNDLRHVLAVAEQYPHLKLRLDANGRLALPAALQLARDLAAAGTNIDYLEQPVASTQELLQLRHALAREGIKIRIAADESVRKADDYLEVARLGAADLLVLKVAPLGGIRNAMAVAEAAGLPITVSSALETSIGLSTGAWLAGSLPVLGIPLAPAGLDTARLLSVDPAKRPLKIEHGRLQITRTELDEDLAAKLAAPPDRANWWRQRLADCLA